MRVFFFGTPEIAVPALQTLAADRTIKIVGVGTPPNKPVGRRQILTPCPVRVAAEKLGLAVHDVPDRATIEKMYAEQNFDLAVVIAFGVIFPKKVLEKKPTLNVHFSLLPRWRGASPVQSAILAGDENSGITVQKMTAELDAGAIAWQHVEKIDNRTTAQLWTDWARLTAEKMPEILKNFDPKKLLHQDETAATHCRKFSRADGEIFPEIESATEIFKKFRAFDPWPGIWLTTPSGIVKILACSDTPTEESVPLPCADGQIFLEKIQLAGRSAASATDVLRGTPDLFLR